MDSAVTRDQVPTKLRVILQQRDGRKYTGKMAIALLCKFTQRSVLSMNYPIGWYKLSKIEKLKFLAAKLPKGHTLVVFREPRYCRKNRSMYLKNLHSGALIQNEPIAPLFEEFRRVRVAPQGDDDGLV